MSEINYSSSEHHYERISGYVTGDAYHEAVKKTIPPSTRLHHVLGEAERLVTDALYDLLAEMNTQRIEWLRIGHESEAACYARMISEVESKIESVKVKHHSGL